MPRSLKTLVVRTPSGSRHADENEARVALSIEQLEEEGAICRMIEGALMAGSGRQLSTIRWEGERADVVRKKIEAGVERAGRSNHITVVAEE